MTMKQRTPERKKSDLLNEFDIEGFVVVREALGEVLINDLTRELSDALDKENAYHTGNEDRNFFGYVLNNAVYGGSFLDLIGDEHLFELVEEILGENAILYSCTSSSMPPFSGNAASEPHVDCPILLPGYPLRIGVMLPLVDFTDRNGGTTVFPRSQNFETLSESEYGNGAKPLDLKAGDMFIFNARLWHSGGINQTGEWRHALTFNWCRPWMKQYINMPKLLGSGAKQVLGETALRRLGYFSQPPESYEEFYDQRIVRKFL